MIKIFETKNPEEIICPKHHIELAYKKENDELILKCDWCNYTLVPATNERLEKLGIIRLKSRANEMIKTKNYSSRQNTFYSEIIKGMKLIDRSLKELQRKYRY